MVVKCGGCDDQGMWLGWLRQEINTSFCEGTAMTHRRPRKRCENIKMDLAEIGCENLSRVKLA
jgi:hypothetical protein